MAGPGWLYPATCFSLWLATGHQLLPALQVKPLEGSLENVNGRGCNETAEGGRLLNCAAFCVQGLLDSDSGVLWSIACKDKWLLQPTRPACTSPPCPSGHTVAKEQFCDPVQYYTGQHAACFGQVRHHYHSDAHELQYGPAELSSDGTAVQ